MADAPIIRKSSLHWWLLPLFLAPLLAWLLPEHQTGQENFSPDHVNLALRRTAHQLLRQSGDSSSLILPVEQTAVHVWKLSLNQSFRYDSLPAILQQSLDLYGIRNAYTVGIHRCEDGLLDLGYHQSDYLQSKDVPCGGRETPPGCHYVEIAFLGTSPTHPNRIWLAGLLLLVSGSLAFYFWYKNQKKQSLKLAESETTGQNTWLRFGNSRLDMANLTLVVAGAAQTLTYREAKLLELFAKHPNQLLERDHLLQEVWANEGILVGRSVDVFVSRLRKKLQADSTLGIVAVHGLGYKLEIKSTA